MGNTTFVIGWVGLIFLTLLNILASVVLFRSSSINSSLAPDTHNYSYVREDFPTELPFLVGPAAMTVESTQRYGLTADDDWMSIFPKGNGWIRLGLEGRPFALSMYHQLHCLDAIRVAMTEARSATHSGGNRPANPNHSAGEDAFEHANHCFNYLRQMLLCTSDLTLESSEVLKRPDGVLDSGASGLGMTHKCKDWTQVRSILEDNYEKWKGIPVPGL
ncbi:hypothetical protein AcV5_000302 [Taiwanofungus camphoratus]|nr:hypothetical protein AcV5_000302 [Antrodia cinnamomea]